MEGNFDMETILSYTERSIDASSVISVLDNSVINSENVIRNFHFLVEHAFSRSLTCKYMILEQTLFKYIL